MTIQSFTPPADPVFQHLLSEAAVSGAVPVYGIVVSAAKLVAFDPAFHPEESAEGADIVRSIMTAWQAGHPAQPWVYPRGDEFVVSDDYFALAAIRRGNPGTLACQCLGEPKSGSVVSSTGPLTREWVRKSLGLTAATA